MSVIVCDIWALECRRRIPSAVCSCIEKRFGSNENTKPNHVLVEACKGSKLLQLAKADYIQSSPS